MGDAAAGSDGVDLLRDAGLRVTRPRLAVLAALGEGEHLGVEAIAGRARRDVGTLSTQAAYDILHAFATAGLVRRIEPAGSPALCETRVGDNHHHVVCRSCGATDDVDCAVGTRPCLEPASSNGFLIDEAEVIFWGTCPDCQSARPQSGRPHSGHTERDPS